MTTEGDDADRHDELVKFYTAVYHALMAPTTYSESNGQYLGFDGAAHTAVPSDGPFMSDMSIWDIFRCQVRSNVAPCCAEGWVGKVMCAL